VVVRPAGRHAWSVPRRCPDGRRDGALGLRPVQPGAYRPLGQAAVAD